jgi:hypothetical protein
LKRILFQRIAQGDEELQQRQLTRIKSRHTRVHKSLKNESAEELHQQALSIYFKMNDNQEKRWIQQSIIDVAQLLVDDEDLNLADYSEADMLTTIWQFVYKLLKMNMSTIKAKLDKRSNTASSIVRNEGRGVRSSCQKRKKSYWGKSRYFI